MRSAYARVVSTVVFSDDARSHLTMLSVPPGLHLSRASAASASPRSTQSTTTAKNAPFKKVTVTGYGSTWYLFCVGNFLFAFPTRNKKILHACQPIFTRCPCLLRGTTLQAYAGCADERRMTSRIRNAQPSRLPLRT